MRTSQTPHHRRIACLGALTALGVVTGPAAACIDIGVYQDDPVASLGPLTANVGPAVNTVSTYVTAGKALDPKIVKLARAKRLKLLVTWAPDNGRPTVNQPGFRNSAVAAGKLDKSLAAFTKSLVATKVPVILRPMPEPNVAWFAWSANVNENTPATYVAAWKRVATTVRAASKGKVKLLWSPHYRSVPADEGNALAAYYPGSDFVDLVGVSGHNFGAQSGHVWKDPGRLFQASYNEVQAFAKGRPFWIAETGSTGLGGDKAAWISALGTLDAKAMPLLRGVVWYDQREKLGDFRIRSGKKETAAFKALVKKRGCTAKKAARKPGKGKKAGKERQPLMVAANGKGG